MTSRQLPEPSGSRPAADHPSGERGGARPRARRRPSRFARRQASGQASCHALRRALRELLAEGRVGEIARLAAETRQILGTLTALTNDAETLVARRAIEALGVAAARVADSDAGYVREHLRRLAWSMNEESGGIGWHAPEAMAEIVRRRPVLFADYIPIVVYLIAALTEEDLEHFRSGVLWAIGRLGSIAARPGLAECVAPAMVAALRHIDPQVRGMAVWSLAQVGQARQLAERTDLLSDPGVVELYEAGQLRRISVGQLLRQMLAHE